MGAKTRIIMECNGKGLLKISPVLLENELKFIFHSCCKFNNPLKDFTYSISEFEDLLASDNFEERLNSFCKDVSDENGFGLCDFKEKSKVFKGVHLSLIVACNINCNFCYNREVRKEFNKYNSLLSDLYFRFLEKLKTTNFQNIKLTGMGEPFLNKEKLYSFIKSIPKESSIKNISFITNGTLIDEEFFEIMENSHLNFDITISLNAYNKESYKKITGVDLFEKVLNNIDDLKEYSELNDNLKFSGVSFVISKDIMSDISNFFKFISEFKYSVFFMYDREYIKPEIKSLCESIERNHNMKVK